MEEVTKSIQEENHFGLNNFVLWCKGWYRLTDSVAQNIKDEEERVFETLKRVLFLDDYYFADNKKNILLILANNLERYNKWAFENNYKTLSATDLIHGIQDKMDCSYTEETMSYFMCVILVLKEFFGWHYKMDLNPPIYDKNLFKMGLTAENKRGLTYKEMYKSTLKMKFMRSEEYSIKVEKRIKDYLFFRK